MIRIIAFSFLLGCAIAGKPTALRCPADENTFPSEFKFGAATSAYQVEGAWNTDGKVENIWDRFTHQVPSKIVDGSNGDVACDHYSQYLGDIQYMQKLGIRSYRFSISMSRIIQSFYPFKTNPAGVLYYHKLLVACREYNIEPVMTLYHWDLHQELQDIGGWQNKAVIKEVVKFAMFCIKEYGSKVKTIITFNEPWSFNVLGLAELAPGFGVNGYSEYRAAHHVLLAHATIYRKYKKGYRYHNGRIGLALNSAHALPLTDSKDDSVAARISNEFFMGWFAAPVTDGDYPEVMRYKIDQYSKAEGLATSRLPVFTEEEKKMLKGSVDFIGLNYYTCRYATLGLPVPHFPSWALDQNVTLIQNTSQVTSNTSTWLSSCPQGFREQIRYASQYNVPLLITENGWSDSGELDDYVRIQYLVDHLKELRQAMCKDNIRVEGYYFWSLLDNFEWANGYTAKFGLLSVNFDDPNRPRDLKKSTIFYSNLAKSKVLKV